MGGLGAKFENCFVSLFFKNYLEPIQFFMVSLFYCTTTVLWCVREVKYAHLDAGYLKDFDWDTNKMFMYFVIAQMTLNASLLLLLLSIFLGCSRCCRPDETPIRRLPRFRPENLGANLSLVLTVSVYLGLLAVDIGVIIDKEVPLFWFQFCLDASGYLFQILYWGTTVKDFLWGKGGKKLPGSFSSYKVRDYWLLTNIFLVFGLMVVVIAMNVQFETVSTVDSNNKWQYSNSVLENILIALCLQLALRFWDARGALLDDLPSFTTASVLLPMDEGAAAARTPDYGGTS